MTERANPFGDLGDFKAGTTRKKADPKILDEIASASDFPSRAARPKPEPKAEEGQNIAATTTAHTNGPGRAIRRYTTGRNRQINVKATEETIALFYEIADEMNQPLGAVLQLALESLSRKKVSG